MSTDGDRSGVTYDPARDRKRLNRQAALVWNAIKDGSWYTLRQISEMTGAPEASISARLRDWRKPEFGSYTIEREYVARGLWRYRLVLAAQGELFQ